MKYLLYLIYLNVNAFRPFRCLYILFLVCVAGFSFLFSVFIKAMKLKVCVIRFTILSNKVARKRKIEEKEKEKKLKCTLKRTHSGKVSSFFFYQSI